MSLRIYVPSSHSNGGWLTYASTARDAEDWTEVTPGNSFSFGDICSADYRSDKNIVSVTGAMGERLAYTFLPFIIKNDHALPHTYIYDIGFSDPILNPSSRSTGLNSSGTPNGVLEQFSNGGAVLDAQLSASPNFQGFGNNNFGFQVLGVSASTASIWDLQSNYFWHDADFAFETSGSRFSMAPEILARAFDYTYSIGRSSSTINVSDDNANLGQYRPYLFKANNRDGGSWMKTNGSLSYPPVDGSTLMLERTAFLWGFFYFACIDAGKMTHDTSIATNRYETNLITGGSPSDANYLYPLYPNDFSVRDHGKWTSEQLGVGNAPPARSRTVSWGTVNKCREARTGWFVAGRRVD